MSKSDFTASNLVKGYYLNNAEADTRIIDSNSKIEEKLERIRMIMPVIQAPEASENRETGEFVGGLEVEMLDALMSEDGISYDEEGNPVSNVIKVGTPEVQEPVYEGPSPEELIAEANEEIERMRQAAEAEIEGARNAGYEEGLGQGYNDGMAKAEAELQNAWAELENARQSFNAECEQYMAEIEPQFIQTLTAIYEKVIQINLSEQQDVIVNLLHNTLSQIETGKNYLIHVSADDYEYVSEHRSELVTSSMPEDVTIDIVEDFTMKAGDAMIETVSGIYDCGVGTQMSALKKKLEILSYTP